MELTIGKKYMVGNTECALKCVNAISEVYTSGNKDTVFYQYECLMITADGFEKWVMQNELKGE